MLHHRGPTSGLGLHVRMLDVVVDDDVVDVAVDRVLHDLTNVVVVVDDVHDAWPAVQRRHVPKREAAVDDVAWLALPHVPMLDVAVDSVLVRPRDLKLDVVVDNVLVRPRDLKLGVVVEAIHALKPAPRIAVACLGGGHCCWNERQRHSVPNCPCRHVVKLHWNGGPNLPCHCVHHRWHDVPK